MVQHKLQNFCGLEITFRLLFFGVLKFARNVSGLLPAMVTVECGVSCLNFEL